MKRLLTALGLATMIAAVGAPRVAAAQEKPAPTLIPLKVQLVISRYQGDKKIGSLPYTLWVTANSRETTRLRMGVDVPVPMTVFTTKEGANPPVASYNYRSVGTNIDCRAESVADGTFRVSITLNDSAVQFDSEAKGTRVTGAPAFRNFTATFDILLKDGQTAQYTSATDPVSGEVLKVDATLNLLK